MSKVTLQPGHHSETVIGEPIQDKSWNLFDVMIKQRAGLNDLLGDPVLFCVIRVIKSSSFKLDPKKDCGAKIVLSYSQVEQLVQSIERYLNSENHIHLGSFIDSYGTSYTLKANIGSGRLNILINDPDFVRSFSDYQTQESLDLNIGDTYALLDRLNWFLDNTSQPDDVSYTNQIGTVFALIADHSSPYKYNIEAIDFIGQGIHRVESEPFQTLLNQYNSDPHKSIAARISELIESKANNNEVIALATSFPPITFSNFTVRKNLRISFLEAGKDIAYAPITLETEHYGFILTNVNNRCENQVWLKDTHPLED